jgi:hypothetical protein
MTSVGLFTRAMACAIVKVLPEPVTPMSVWYFFPSAVTPAASLSIACGWSPSGLNGLTTSNRSIGDTSEQVPN